jgi:hypothetical protein
VVRRKAFGLARLTVEEAIAELEALDLFTERVTGADSVVYTTVRGYRVAQAEPRPDLVAGPSGRGSGSAGEMVSFSEVPAPRLAGLEQPFIFFAEPGSGRGNLLYFRYDGDLGLITPSDGCALAAAAWGRGDVGAGVRYPSSCRPCGHPRMFSWGGYGRLPEWPKGAVCKTVGSAYVGSNPTPATSCENSC